MLLVVLVVAIGALAIATGDGAVVDVSIEPHDGDPTHSGNSILRGGLIEA